MQFVPGLVVLTFGVCVFSGVAGLALVGALLWWLERRAKREAAAKAETNLRLSARRPWGGDFADLMASLALPGTVPYPEAMYVEIAACETAPPVASAIACCDLLAPSSSRVLRRYRRSATRRS